MNKEKNNTPNFISNKAMTFEQCCDEVAKKHFNETFLKEQEEGIGYFVGEFFYWEIIKEAAELFSQSCKAEAWEEGFNAAHASMKVVNINQESGMAALSIIPVINPYLTVNPYTKDK